MAKKFRRLYFDPETGQYYALFIGQNINSFIYEGTFDSSPYVISHGEDTTNVVISVFDTDGGEIIPDGVEIIDGDTVNVYFNESFEGKIHLTTF